MRERSKGQRGDATRRELLSKLGRVNLLRDDDARQDKALLASCCPSGDSVAGKPSGGASGMRMSGGDEGLEIDFW